MSRLLPLVVGLCLSLLPDGSAASPLAPSGSAPPALGAPAEVPPVFLRAGAPTPAALRSFPADILDARTARARALELLHLPGDTPADIERGWLPIDSGQHLPAYQLRVVTLAPPQHLIAWIHAQSGAPIWALDALRHLDQARIYPLDPDRSPAEIVTLENVTPGSETLEGPYSRVLGCVEPAELDRGGSCEPEALARRDANGDFLFDEPDPLDQSDPFAETQMFHHVEIMHEFFQGLGFPGFDAPLEAIVNYRSDDDRDGRLDAFDNAAFVPGGGRSGPFNGRPFMLFGQGSRADFALDATVISHEFTHAVIGKTSNLTPWDLDERGLNVFPLALNEGSADYFATSHADDSKVGAYIAQNTTLQRQLRDVDNTLRCPDDLFGESHQDGRIWAGALWEVRALLGKETTDQIAYDTISTLESNANFDEAGRSFLEKVEAAVGAERAAAVSEILKTRGILGCEAIVPLGSERHQSFTLGMALLPGEFRAVVPHIPSMVQYTFRVPSNATRLSLRRNVISPPSAGDDIALLVRKGEPVTHSIATLQLVSTFDFEAEAAVSYGIGTPRDGVLFEPCETYYLHPANREEPDLIFEVWLAMETRGVDECPPEVSEETPTPDPSGSAAPTPSPDPGGGGGAGKSSSGCAQAGPAPASLIALGLLLARRRRRSR